MGCQGLSFVENLILSAISALKGNELDFLKVRECKYLRKCLEKTEKSLHLVHFRRDLCAESGEGNGSPLQCSCLENPMDGGAWWAAVHGVGKSWARLIDFTSLSLSCTGEGNGNPLQ